MGRARTETKQKRASKAAPGEPALAGPARGIDEVDARALTEAWRKFARIERAIAKTRVGFEVATSSTQVEYLAASHTLVIRQGIGVNYNAPITDPVGMAKRLAVESAAQGKLLNGATLELAVLPHRHLDPLVRPFRVKPALEIVASRTIDDPAMEAAAFIDLVKKTMKAGLDWRKKRDLLFPSGR